MVVVIDSFLSLSLSYVPVVLKVVALETNGFTEKRNLRVGKSNLNFSTNDIRWHPRTFVCLLSHHFHVEAVAGD